MTASRTTITEVEPLAECWVRLTFGDGAVHEVDLAGLLSPGGVFASIRDHRDVFEAVAVDHEFATIVWPTTSISISTSSAATRPQPPDERFPDE